MIMKTSYQGLGHESHHSKHLSRYRQTPVYQSAFRLYLQVAKYKKENEKLSSIFRNFLMSGCKKQQYNWFNCHKLS